MRFLNEEPPPRRACYKKTHFVFTCIPPLHPCRATSILRPLIFTTASFLFWNPVVQKLLLGLHHVAAWPVPMESVCASCLSRTWFRFRVNRGQRCCPEHAFVFGSMPWFVSPRKKYPALVTIRHLFATRTVIYGTGVSCNKTFISSP